MKNFMASPTATETTSSASSSCSIDVTGSHAKRARTDLPDVVDFPKIDGVNDVARNLSESPQPILKEYKKTMFGSISRYFNKSWFTGRPWLECSLSANAAFCYCCRAFSNSSTSDQWTKIGFVNWKGAMEENKGFKSHEASEPHITAWLKWCNFKESFRSGNIIVKMQAISRQDILDNRHFIKTVIQAVVLCNVQDLGLRGHREGRLTGDSSELGFSCGDRNRGNFLEILSSYAVHDPVVRRKLMSGPRHAQYTHHSIQDQLISLLSKYVRDDILTNLKSAKFFAILCDETKDVGKKEQLSICLRYVDCGVLHEDFYNFVKADGLDSRSVMAVLKEQLEGIGVDSASHLIAQCYDGASVMSGRLAGLQADASVCVPLSDLRTLLGPSFELGSRRLRVWH